MVFSLLGLVCLLCCSFPLGIYFDIKYLFVHLQNPGFHKVYCNLFQLITTYNDLTQNMELTDNKNKYVGCQRSLSLTFLVLCVDIWWEVVYLVDPRG